MATKNTTATTSETATTDNAVPETRVSVPMQAAREVTPVLASLAITQSQLDGQMKRADIIRTVAENTLSDINAVSALLALASESIAAQKTSDKTICAQEMLAQCYAVVEDYNRASDSTVRALALDTLRVKYAALSVWLTTSGKAVRDSLTGESRERSESEKNALRMARAIGAQATRLVPFALTPEKRAEVDTFVAARLAKRGKVVDSQPSVARIASSN